MPLSTVEKLVKKHINDEELMKAVCDKLADIKSRLMISKGISKKEETVLSIEKYVELAFDDAIKLFVENKDQIFKEILKSNSPILPSISHDVSNYAGIKASAEFIIDQYGKKSY